ncbi:conserved hypothetical protein [Tenacibaculum sp. 190524A05c]
MNDIYIFLVLLLILIIFFTYKLIKGIKDFYNYKYGFTESAKVLEFNWLPTPPTRLSYLFPKEQLRITYSFEINGELYKKTEDDIHFQFKKINPHTILKINDIIRVYVPKNNNPNKVTINKPKDSILPLVFLTLILFLCLIIFFSIISFN